MIDFEDVSATRGYSVVACLRRLEASPIFCSPERTRPDASMEPGSRRTCLHPGVVRIGFGREGPWFIRFWFASMGRFLLSPEMGAVKVPGTALRIYEGGHKSASACRAPLLL